MLIFLYKCSIVILRLNIKDYKIVALIWFPLNLYYLSIRLSGFNHNHQMPQKNYSQWKRIAHLYDYNFFIMYIRYKNTHDRTILIFLNPIIFLKIGSANLDVAPISRFFRTLLLNILIMIFFI